MAAVKISGVLKDGAGKPIQNCTIQLKAKRNSTTVLVNTVASENPDEAGRYSMDVEYGQYSVTLLVEGFPPSHAGFITVYEGSSPGTLNDFLGAMTEDDVMPEALRRFQEMVEEAARNAEAASQSAAAAKTSETAAASSKNAAKTSETNAANSAQAAASSKTAAQNAATAASRSETNARASEEASADNEEASRRNAESATENAGIATTKAAEAAASAVTAGQKKDEAVTAATRSEAAADRAEAAAEVTAEPYANIVPPLPDVWIPFNDSLDMITGFSPSYKKIVIGDDEITVPGDKIVKFKRASTATYINKSGSFVVADVDEARFEKSGLLIEGQRTNNFINSNAPEAWNFNNKRLDVNSNLDPFGFSYGVLTYKDSSDTGPVTLISTGTGRVISVENGDSVTISARFKGNGIRARMRISKLNDDGAGDTFIADALLDLSNLTLKSDVLSSSFVVENSGWIFFQSTYKSDSSQNIYARIEMYQQEGNEIKVGDSISMATPQVEKGTAASSFIITGGTPATRASDIVTIPLNKNWVRRPLTVLTECSVSWDVMPNTTGAARILNISTTGDSTDIADQSYVYLGFISKGSKAIITNGKGTMAEIKSDIAVSGRKNIIGGRFKEDGSLSVVVNGNIGGASVSPYNDTRYLNGFMNIGGQSSTGDRHLFGHIRNLRIWHRELNDRQLKEAV
ncbi:prophage tail fiber N-terminal domain-containing protein [Escherichia coli]|uniref:prophage tail fiber N-terminal domain-containing protein n=1 Tax=Escherichia coli TaxID=562 RepID=UPI000BE15954|nr:prophage tail fiber N-terminal domain-containing protein [Escherichia coli]EIJ4836062.1 prophage tail fiber N-terminal domain-containing protein [Escherichia coli]EKG6948203.1 prophage tail fiber N-terminal domain-containing protein [Escherichia coli]QAZ72472.1 Phage tail fiber protein [Escherichia coli]HBN2037689.1 prophage tail fiber N-terminal domain-containing protein [Escherichia coli]HCO9876303.1 prophage tail fiber N-terminal domain-containing protein [Escherichia coli]